MQYWLDIVGSFLIGGLILLILVNLNLSMSNSAAENLNTNLSQGNLTTTTYVIEHDIYKIGYRVTGEKIVIADSAELKFYTDIDNNGTKDSIHYYLGDPSQMFFTFNPNDRLLYRVMNNEKPTSSIIVVDFNLSYYDSTGAIIDYTSLKNASVRGKVKTVTVSMGVESADPVEGEYQGAEWKKNIIAKNL
jgi:hypothetical protein